MEASEKTQKMFHNITDVFTGADGGLSFINFRLFNEWWFIRHSQKQRQKSSRHHQKCCDYWCGKT